MNNNTLENYYKKAVKNKYEEIKDGDNFIYLNHPTRAKLNKFCWEIFETNKMHSDDLVAVNSLLGLPFDINTKNKFRQQTNQFRPIETFFKGETDPEKIDVVDLAAILVDYQPRPFAKFRKQFDPDELKLIDVLRDTPFFNPKFSSDDLIDEVKIEGYGEDIELFNTNFFNETFSSNNLIDEVKNENDSEENFNIEEPKQAESHDPDLKQESAKNSTSVNNNDKTPNKVIRNLVIITILLGLCIGISLAMRKKECMVWVVDHYEEKSRSDEGYCDSYYDSRYFNLKKITVCDSTTFFDSNGKAKIWYFKVSPNSIECFDRYAPYPLNTSRNLKPITQYMIDTYLADRLKFE